ncbi:MAG: DNA translocase FtsK [Clostridiales bacterium]|nr:DNA translocase FtsK [Clostridiales bacterium]
MAQSTNSSKKNTAAAKKTDTKGKSGGKAANTVPPEPPAAPINREITAFIFFFIAVFIIISYFNTEGAVIAFAANLIKGLFGWGYWLSAPAFLAAAFILAFHKGRPVALRVTAVFLLPILFAAMGNLFFAEPAAGDFDLKTVVGGLFLAGQALNSGGVAGGLIAVGLELALSIYGAFPLLLVLFVVCVFVGFKISLADIIGKVRENSARYSEAETEPAPVIQELPEKKKRRTETKSEKKIERIPRASFPVDIPLGEDEEELPLNDLRAYDPEEEKTAARRTKVRKKSPEESAPTREVAPLSVEEAASMAGVNGDEGFVDIPVPPKTKRARVTMSAEISDPPKAKKLSREDVAAEAQAMAEAIAGNTDGTGYEFPPVSLLRAGSSSTVDSKDEVMLNKERLEGAIRSFGISAAIVGVIRGPTVTRYDIELDQGVKLSRVTNLAGDLALALGVINVRIAPIPDKISTVGIEVPNKIVSTVYLRDILESPQFVNAKSKLSFALGKDIGGECIVGNIAKLPHMLIAGTTGSGKSVCMNSLILSLLYKARPDEVKLIMIDPKMVELGVYNGIPHLYVPVVTDPKKAAGALQWSVVEMLKRYRLFSEVGVRDLENYNKHCEASGEQTLPRVVIVIDELADLMMIASKEVEESICRVAQMGRAAGMHLVIATQRPSADVITGLMKANIPSRIAFAVSSAMESRIILDQGGAEKLVGMGDMLFSPVGCGKPTRIQGAFVSDEEREEVIQFIKESAGTAQQNSEIEEYMNKAAEDKSASDSGKNAQDDGEAGGFDEMLPQAAEVVIEMKSCSVSMLQRRVKLGYSRAARIVDQLEELGIVGPYEGAKPRQVLVDRAGWHDIQVQLGLASDDDLSLAAEMNEENNYE